ncbi:MAG: glycoside hydrolase family 25 protein [Rhodobacteraceae bacterium]|nr:glycoside hydrolase family 25 protein [Paracoccaceae bacterium]
MRGVFLFVSMAFLASCGAREAPQKPQKITYQAATMASSNHRFEDTDPYEWTGRKPWNYPVHGIDVARYQNEIDWRQVRRSGVSFAYIKATEGGDHLDERFKENWRGAKRAGIPRGAYHFYYFCRPASEQARWFIRNVPRDGSALPPVLDIEWNHRSPTCDLRPEPRVIRAEMRVFLKRIASHYGKRPVIYATPEFYHTNELWRVRGYEFWLRSVADHPSEKYPGRGWAFWQYTGTGVVPGVEGRADINVFRGSREAWQAWVAGNIVSSEG